MSVSNGFKNITKKIKQQNIKLSICDSELTVKEIHMMPVHIFNALPIWKLREQKEVIAKELKYSFDGQLFKTIMKQVEITVKNANEIKDKDINFQYGLFINNKFEYIDLGNYFIKDIEDSKKKDEITVTGYDRMIRFMKTFKQSELQLTYPCKMIKLVQKMCEVCGVELYSTDFYNANLDVEEDFFTAQELTYRDVLEKIAQVTLTTAFIENNKLNLYKVSDDAIEKIDKSYLTNLTIKEKFGPANALVLGRGDVEDNIEETDEKSIEQNGRCEIRFDENEFIEFQREKVIKGMFEQIKGLEYYSFEASDVGVMWLKPCSCIELGDKEDCLYKSYYLKANITINTGISSDIEAELPEETNTEYKVTTKEEKKTLKVERLAKKNKGLIQDLIEEVGDRSKKKTSITQDIDSISQKVSDIEDLTNDVEGVKTITLGNCVEGKLLSLHIYGNGTVFNYLYPSDTLYPNDSLYPCGDSRIVVGDKDGNQTIYELGVLEVLRSNDEVHDEFILENGQAKVIRRVNKSGSTKAKEKIEDLGKVEILLKEGTNTITIQNYTARIKAKWAVKSDYTNVLATKVEMKSEIKQTAEEINLEVRKKVDENEVISKINQSAEEIQIQADKIDISGKAVNFKTKIAKTVGPYTTDDSEKIRQYLMGETTLTAEEFERYDITEDGIINSLDWYYITVAIRNGGYYSFEGTFQIDPYSYSKSLSLYNDKLNRDVFILSLVQNYFSNLTTDNLSVEDGQLVVRNSAGEMYTQDNDYFELYIDGKLHCTNKVTCESLEQTSLSTHKKNFEKLQDNALNILKTIDIYKYNLKNEKDTDKKHIGFVIGDNFKYSKEVTSLNNQGVDNYSFTSLCCKAIQELSQQVEELKKQLKEER